jgi:hypothetical protein
MEPNSNAALRISYRRLKVSFELQPKAPKVLEEFMNRWRVLFYVAAVSIFCGSAVFAQAQESAPSSDTPAYAVATGTRILVSLQTPISTKVDKAGKRIHVRTLEPIITQDGSTLPPGAEIRGHLDKVQSAGKTGRAHLWITFDDIRTRNGWVPLVAALIDAPGVHSIRVLYDREGEIEAPTSNRDQEALAMAMAALAGAEPGIAGNDKKDAAKGAATGAAEAFIATSGIGQDLTLAENMKLEIALRRPLYFGKI